MQHFSLERLSDGVYAAIHVDDGWAISNAGIIDLGDRTLVFDTLMTPRAAQDLYQAAAQVTGRPARLVVNSHYHNDHIWGNQVFADAEIISTIETRRLIDTLGREEFTSFRDNSAARLEDTRRALAEEQDADRRADLAQGVIYYQAVLESFPNLEIRLPNITFQDRLILQGPARKAELISLGPGHTGDDSVLYLPQEGILFMSDLLFIGYHPYLADGDPAAALRALDEVAKIPAQVLVPGHGRVGSRADLETMRDYLRRCEELARGFVERGAREEEVAGVQIPAPFERWRYANFFDINVRFLYQQAKSQKSRPTG